MATTGEPSPDGALSAVGARVWLGGHDTKLRGLIERRLVGVRRPPTGPLDAAFITPLCVEEAVHFAGKLRKRLVESGILTVFHAVSTGTDGRRTSIAPDELNKAMRRVGFTRMGDVHLEGEVVVMPFGLAPPDGPSSTNNQPPTREASPPSAL